MLDFEAEMARVTEDMEERMKEDVTKWKGTESAAVRAEMAAVSDQLIAEMAVQGARLDNFAAMRSSGGVTVYEINDEHFSGTIISNGIIAHVNIRVSADFISGDVWKHDLPPNLAPIGIEFIRQDDYHFRVTPPGGDGIPYFAFFSKVTPGETTSIQGAYHLASVTIAEVIDGRVGYDGTIYPNAGDAVRGQIGNIETLFDTETTEAEGANILNPQNGVAGTYPASPVVGEPLSPSASTSRTITVDPIPVTAGEKLYVSTNLQESTANVVYYFLDSSECYVSLSTVKLSTTITAQGSQTITIPNNVAFLHLSLGGLTSGIDFNNLCISRSQLSEFEEYASAISTSKVLKEDALPSGYSGLPLAIHELSDQASKIKPKLQGKVIVNFGDSIFGLRRPPLDISTKLAELTGATVHNLGFGGCTMAWHGSGTSANPNYTNFDPFSMYRLADEIVKPDDDETKWVLQQNAISSDTSLPSYYSEPLQILMNLDFSKVDIITIAYGTNDLTRANTLDNETDRYKTTTFAGALRYSIEKLLAAYPHLKIFLCSQTFRFWITDGEVTNTSDTWTNTSDTWTNTKGNKLTDFVAKTEEVAKEYHLPFINNYDIGLNVHNRSHYFSATDGTHPLTVGLHLIAEHMAKELF